MTEFRGSFVPQTESTTVVVDAELLRTLEEIKHEDALC